jgi:hypothetical protein
MKTRSKKRKQSEEFDDDIPPNSDTESVGSDSEDSDYDDYEELNSDYKHAMNTLKKKNPEYYKRFLKAKAVIKSREITIHDILSCQLQDDKRATLLEKYECFKNIEPYTEEYLEHRDRLRSLLYKYTTEHILQSSPPFSTKNTDKTDKKTESNPFSVFAFKKLTDAEVEISQFKTRISQLTCSPQNRKAIEDKLTEFEDNLKGEEKSKIKKWLNLALTVPFDRLATQVSSEQPSQLIQTMSAFLNKKLFGMKNVKERLMLFLNKKLREGNSRGCNIALVGKPGVGKTAIAKALSECLQLPFAQVSFGGVTNADFLMGHDYTYVGSRPGEITRCLIRMGAKNGILFFDEFDKATDKKDIMSTLLHITDFSQNNEFRDNYVPELTQDLSKLWFIYSMNVLPTDPAMLDRLEIIYVDEYTTEERVLISKHYLIPKYTNELKLEEIQFTDAGIKHIVHLSSGGSDKKGVRDLERFINLIIEKVYFYIHNRDVEYEYKWFQKIKSCDENGIKITPELAELILQDAKKESCIPCMMYL